MSLRASRARAARTRCSISRAVLPERRMGAVQVTTTVRSSGMTGVHPAWRRAISSSTTRSNRSLGFDVTDGGLIATVSGAPMDGDYTPSSPGSISWAIVNLPYLRFEQRFERQPGSAASRGGVKDQERSELISDCARGRARGVSIKGRASAQRPYPATTFRQKRSRLSNPPTVELQVVVSQIRTRPANTSGFDCSRASKSWRPAAVKGCGGACMSMGWRASTSSLSALSPAARARSAAGAGAG